MGSGAWAGVQNDANGRTEGSWGHVMSVRVGIGGTIGYARRMAMTSRYPSDGYPTVRCIVAADRS